MKNIFTKAILSFLLVAPLGSLQAQNLVQNGGAELFDSTTFAPLYWTNNGNWTSTLAGGYVDSVYEGNYMFFEGADSLGSLQQDVDLNSYATQIDLMHLHLSFSCQVQSYDQGDPSDQTAYVIESLNAAKSQVLGSFSSDTAYNVNGWGYKGYDFDAPVGTRYVRIKLISIRNEGSDNDGYFDDVSLVPTIVTGVSNIPSYVTNVTVSPNPAVDNLSVVVRGQSPTHLTITNMQGELILSRQISNAERIDVSALAPGIYFLQTNSNGNIGITRFIKQ